MKRTAHLSPIPAGGPATERHASEYSVFHVSDPAAQGTAGWPPHLWNVIEIMKNSPLAQILLWPANKAMLFNDAYARLDEGSSAAPGLLSAAWNWDSGVLQAALTGSAQAYRKQSLVLWQDSREYVRELDLYYTPLRENTDSGIGAVLCALVPSAHSTPAVAGTLTGMRILVVEDNPDTQYLVCEMLRAFGHDVEPAPDAERAATLLSQQRFDVLFTDVCLPGISGIDLARTAFKSQPRLKIIFASGFGPDLTSRLDFPARALQKPYEIEELQSMLEKISSELH
jgi:CheY-like chemotaxis protein